MSPSKYSPWARMHFLALILHVVVPQEVSKVAHVFESDRKLEIGVYLKVDDKVRILIVQINR